MKVDNFLGVFAKLQKVTITFVMSVCPSIHPSTWNNIFVKFLIFEYFLKICQENSSSIKIQQE